MPISSPGCCWCFWPICYRSEVLKTSSLGLINLLQWLMELRETFYLLDHWFVIKGYNSGTFRGKRCTGQVMGERAQSFLALSEPATFPAPPRVNQPEALRTLSFWGFMEALLHRHDWWNHWPLEIELSLQPLSLPLRSWVELKLPTI